MVALVSKQVTAYNAVNNSTVSRTSASKYGEFIGPSWGGEDALSGRKAVRLDSRWRAPWRAGQGAGGVRQADRRRGEPAGEEPLVLHGTSCRSRTTSPREGGVLTLVSIHMREGAFDL